jgi:hypothetical protein
MWHQMARKKGQVACMATPTVGYPSSPDLVLHAVLEGTVHSMCGRATATLTSDECPGIGGGSLCEECCHHLRPGARA